ncbi:hypothetical protein NBRC116592_27060 [Colwellia sp. KU-HH00111]
MISNTPSTKKFCSDNSNKNKFKTKSLPLGINHCKNEPRAIPKIMPITIRVVKLLLWGDVIVFIICVV